MGGPELGDGGNGRHGGVLHGLAVLCVLCDV